MALLPGKIVKFCAVGSLTFSLAIEFVLVQVRELENCPHFNAGRGSVLTTDGTIEMEASIMDSTKRCGAVSGLTTVVNPISLARLVMEKTPHIYLAFDGAEAFAREQVSNFYPLLYNCRTKLLYILLIKKYFNF